MPADAVHRILHPRQFRAVFKKNIARIHSRIEHFVLK